MAISVRNIVGVVMVTLLLPGSHAAEDDAVKGKPVPELIADLKSEDRDAAFAATTELGKRGKAAVPALTALIKDIDAPGRYRAVISLGGIRDPDTVLLLVACLRDQDRQVRGRAAYSLSLIGGQESRDALVGFLEKCMANPRTDYRNNLSKAAEALKELPDERAFPMLLQLVTTEGAMRSSAGRHAAIALGRIGDPRASEPLAQLLDASVTYDRSMDYIYLQAIATTKGKAAVPYLVRYLAQVAKRIERHAPLPQSQPNVGRGYRQRRHDKRVFSQARGCLEAVAGTRSEGETTAEVVDFWQRHLDSQYKASERKSGAIQ